MPELCLLLFSTDTLSPHASDGGEKTVYSIYLPRMLATGRWKESFGHISLLPQDRKEAGRVERTGLAGLEDSPGITDLLRGEEEPGLCANTGGQLPALRWLTGSFKWRPNQGVYTRASSSHTSSTQGPGEEQSLVSWPHSNRWEGA